MPMPALAPFAQRLYDALEPMRARDAENDYALAHFLSSISAPFELPEFLGVDDGDIPGWTKIFDPNVMPVEGLPWLGQMIGVEVEEGWTEEIRRQAITSKLGWERGTVQALKDTAALYLTGNKQVSVFERDTSPYHLTVITRTDETNTSDIGVANLIHNGDFEIDVSQWAPTNATTLQTTAHSKYGAASLEATITDLSSAWTLTGYMPVIEGEKYSLSMWSKRLSGNRGVFMKVGWYTSADVFISEVYSPETIVPVDSFQQLTLEGIVAPANATKALAFMLFAGGVPLIGDQFVVDGVQLEQHLRSTPFIPTNGAPVIRPPAQGPIYKALQLAKPAGLILVYNVVDGLIYNELDALYATYNTLDAEAWTDYDDVEDGVPGGSSPRQFGDDTFGDGTFG